MRNAERRTSTGITMTKRYSYTRLTTYENCPLQYKYRYIDELKPEGFSIESFMGSRVHETLEKLYYDLMHCKLLSLEELIQFYNERWSKNWSQNIFIVREQYGSENYREVGKKCIEHYYRKFAPFDQDITIALEEPVNIKLNEEYSLIGYIDRLSKTHDGVYEIHDYKTSMTLPTKNDFEKDRQLALYQLGIQDLYPNAKNVRLTWHYLFFDETITITKTVSEIQNLKDEIIALIKQIEESEEFRPHESVLCRWCAYEELCPLQRHKFILEKLTPEQYILTDGVQLVNEFIRIKMQKEKLEEQLEKLRQNIIDYADREKLDVVMGSDYKVRIYKYDDYNFPSKKDDNYEEFVKFIKENNLWDIVSKPDIYAIRDVIKSKEVPKNLRDELLKFGKKREQVRVIPSKLMRDDE